MYCYLEEKDSGHKAGAAPQQSPEEPEVSPASEFCPMGVLHAAASKYNEPWNKELTLILTQSFPTNVTI